MCFPVTIDGATNQVFKRQLNIGKYGRADLVSFTKIGEKQLLVNVYELKKDKISMSAFLQAVGYCKGIRSYIRDYRQKEILLRFNIILIGNSLDTSSEFSFLTDFINSCNFDLMYFTYKYNIDGIVFNYESDYKLMDEGFKSWRTLYL